MNKAKKNVNVKKGEQGFKLSRDDYDITVDGEVIGEVDAKLGGIYTFLITEDEKHKPVCTTHSLNLIILDLITIILSCIFSEFNDFHNNPVEFRKYFVASTSVCRYDCRRGHVFRHGIIIFVQSSAGINEICVTGFMANNRCCWECNCCWCCRDQIIRPSIQ